VLKSKDFTFDGRDAVEDPLDEALQGKRRQGYRSE
jgi:hypothetical protein